MRRSAGGPEDCTRRTFEIMLPNEQHHRFWYDLVILVIRASHLLVRICGPRGARGRPRLAEDEVRRVTLGCLVSSICCEKCGVLKPWYMRADRRAHTPWRCLHALRARG
jgi:hypothetical protein